MQLKSTIHVVREEVLHQLDAVGKACEEYSGANYLQYAPAPRATKAQPQPPKTHEPPPFSNMQIYFLARTADEHEARRAAGDASATVDRWVAGLVKAVEGSRKTKYAWVMDGVDLTPQGHTGHTMRQALAPIAESFVYSGKLRRREKKEEEEKQSNDKSGGGQPAVPRKRGRPKKAQPAPPVEAEVAVATLDAAPAAKKKTKK